MNELVHDRCIFTSAPQSLVFSVVMNDEPFKLREVFTVDMVGTQ